MHGPAHGGPSHYSAPMGVNLVPETLYHYSDVAGLQGILCSKKVWASHPRSMNDLNEAKHGLELAGARLRESASGHVENLARAVRKWSTWQREDEFFIACFSSEMDSLALWRGYAPDNGVSIGIPTVHLESSGELGAVIYDEGTFLSRVEEAIEGAISGVESLRGERLCRELFKLSYLFKSAAWAEEKEWRLLLHRRRGVRREELRFRPGRIGIVPYSEISLSSESGPLVSSLTIGPGAFQSDFVECLSWFLPEVGVLGINPNLSRVGLRPR